MKILFPTEKRTAANRYIAITIVKSLFTRDPHAFFKKHFPHLIYQFNNSIHYALG